MKKLLICLCSLFFLFSLPYGCKSADNRPIDRYFLEIEYENGQIKGKMEYCFCLKSEETNVLFNLYPNQMNIEGCSILISDVSFKNTPCNYKLIEDDAYLSVELPNKHKKGEEITLTVEFLTTVPTSLLRLGQNGTTVNLAYFYPMACFFNEEYVKQAYVEIGDPFYCDFCNMQVNLTLPSVMSVACGFKPVGIENMGEKTTYCYEMNSIKNFACALSDKYNIVSSKLGDTQVNYFYYKDDNPEERLDKMISCLQFLNSEIGQYPYSVLTVAQSLYEYGGMEYSAFCVVGESVSESDYEYSLFHEICHQYFPISFLFNEYNSGYLDEGLTEFLTQSYLEKQKAGVKRAHAQYSASLISAYNRAQNTLGYKVDGVMKKPLNAFSSREEYVVTAYYKGYLLFYHLEKTCGDLLPYLKKAYNKYSFKNFGEKELVSCFGSNKKQAEKIFEENVFKGAIITLD